MANNTQIIAFINKIAPYCQKYAQKYGYKVCSPAIAQALQESLGKESQPEGLSALAHKYNNYHGIKAYPKWTGASVNMKTGEEYTKNVITTVNSNFCIFENAENACEEYFLFLERNPRYKAVKSCTTPESYLSTIRACGYCTSTTYVTNCMKKIYTYSLDKFDNFTPTEIIQPVAGYEVGKVYTLDVNLYVRDSANGNKVKHTSLTANGFNNAFFDEYGYSILKQGTRVTCKEVIKTDDGNIWIKIPSGYICAENKGKKYIK